MNAQIEMDASQKGRQIVPVEEKMKDICYSEID